MPNLPQFLRSIRHSRPRQLLRRVQLMAKRKAISDLHKLNLIPNFLKPAQKILATAPPYTPPELNSSLPLPIFPPRTHLVTRKGQQATLHFLNLTTPLTCPQNWHPAKWKTATRLELLNLHYMEYLEALDDVTFIQTVTDWLTQNTPYQPGYALDNFNSYTLSIRTTVWMQQYALRKDTLPPRFAAALLTASTAQLDFLSRNLETDIGGNHLIKNIKTLLWASRFFATAKAKKYEKIALTLLEKQLAEQILPDGLHYERSHTYHCQVFADLLECYSLLTTPKTKNLQETLAGILRKMAQPLADLTHPDGLPSLFADAGLHTAYSPTDCLTAYHRLTQTTITPNSHINLPHAGYFGLRFANNFLLFNAGHIAPAHLPAHGHGDALAFEWDIDGKRIIVDAGVCEYHPGPLRDYSRSTQSHNTVTLDNLDQYEFWKAFRVGRRAKVTVHHCDFNNKSFTIEASHNGYRHLPGQPTHHRHIKTDTRRIDITDTIENGQNQSPTAHLLFHPDCTLTPTSDNAILITRDNITIKLTTPHSIKITQAIYCPDFGVQKKTHQISIEYPLTPSQGRFLLEKI